MNTKRTLNWAILVLLFLPFRQILAADSPALPMRGDKVFAEYFRTETAQITQHCLEDIRTLADWESRREGYRQQLLEMLGLWPLPERTPLQPVVTGKLEGELFTVENLYFQSSPGLYVTANLYVPKHLPKPAPAILYVCGHSLVKTNGVSYGNKTGYQHHGEWFARNGYVCLIIDTIQLGELEGIHHGTYREGMWWWNSRGYTPAGVEAWNSMRALDYLQSRPEVDPQRLGITGRSGGGAYSWWTAAIDDRIKVAVPVAGITDLQNYVVDGCVEGHCDCMFMVNTYRWDYPLVAAMVAPRPLLLGNSDKDSLFPLDGVVRLHDQVAKIYKLYGKTNNFGLLITEGPHKDTQDLQVPAFRWFNRYLKGEEPLVDMAAVKMFEPPQLKVFGTLPTDERTTKIHTTFVPAAPAPAVPKSAQEWSAQRQAWLTGLLDKSFRGWPIEHGALNLTKAFSEEEKGVRLTAYDFLSQQSMELRLYVVQASAGHKPDKVTLNILGDEEWKLWLRALRVGFDKALGEELDATRNLSPDEQGWADLQKRVSSEHSVIAFLAPRGVGLTATNPDGRKFIQLRRRFMLLGQTLDGMRVWDIRRGVQAVRSLKGLKDVPLSLGGRGNMAVNVLYASLFEPNVAHIDLWEMPASHQTGPDYLNVLRVLDIPAATAMATERSTVVMHDGNANDWSYPLAVCRALGWGMDRLQVARAAK